MEYTIKIETDGLMSGNDLENMIADKIQEEIYPTIQDTVKSKLEDKLVNIIDIEIEKRLSELLDNLLNKEIEITDKWGDVKYKGSIKDRMTKKFEGFLNEQVDDRMQSTKYGGTPRLEKIIKNVHKNEVDKFTKDITKTLHSAVKEKLTDDLKLALGNEIVNSIGVKNVIDKLKLEQLPTKK